MFHRADHATKQAHELTDFATAGLVFALAAATSLGEQRSHHLVEHVDGGVTQAAFEKDQLGDDGSPSAADAVAAQQEGWRDRPFTNVLLEAPLMDGFGD